MAQIEGIKIIPGDKPEDTKYLIDCWQEDGTYSWVKSPNFYGKAVELGPLAWLMCGLQAGHEATRKHFERIVSMYQLLSGQPLSVDQLPSTLGRVIGRSVHACVLHETLAQQWQALVANIGSGDHETFIRPNIPLTGEIREHVFVLFHGTGAKHDLRRHPERDNTIVKGSRNIVLQRCPGKKRAGLVEHFALAFNKRFDILYGRRWRGIFLRVLGRYVLHLRTAKGFKHRRKAFRELLVIKCGH